MSENSFSTDFQNKWKANQFILWFTPPTLAKPHSAFLSEGPRTALVLPAQASPAPGGTFCCSFSISRSIVIFIWIQTRLIKRAADSCCDLTLTAAWWSLWVNNEPGLQMEQLPTWDRRTAFASNLRIYRPLPFSLQIFCRKRMFSAMLYCGFSCFRYSL